MSTKTTKKSTYKGLEKRELISPKTQSLIISPGLPSSIALEISSFTQTGNHLFFSAGTLNDYLMASIGGNYFCAPVDCTKFTKIEEALDAVKTLILEKDSENRFQVVSYTGELYNYQEYEDSALYKCTKVLAPGSRIVVTDTSKLILTSTQYEIWGEVTDCYNMYYTDDPNKIIVEIKPDADPRKCIFAPDQY